MKKNLLLSLVYVFLIYQSSGQTNCNNVRISPNEGSRGQTLTTTISGTGFFNGMGSAPCNPSDVYLQQNSSATTIYATSLSIQNDSINVTWDIPANAPGGGYHVVLDLYQYSATSSCLTWPITCVTPNVVFSIDATELSGTVYYDSNQDSIFNSGDIRLQNRGVRLLPENIIALTDQNGAYSFLCDTGAHTVILMNNSAFTPVSSDTITLNVGPNNIDSIDFAVYPSTTNFYSSIYLWGRARCNTTQNYNLHYHSSAYIPVNLLIKFYHSANTPFVSSNPAPDSIVGDTVYISVMNYVYYYGEADVQVQIPNAGDSVSFGVIMETYDMGGNLVSTATDSRNSIVSCSFDPNDKYVNPVGESSQHFTLFDESLFYTIHFQNTGNDTAYEVHIIDSIDASLDISTLEIISSSHPYRVEINSDNVVDFIFNRIMLPDSFVDKPGSNGYISYAIKSLSVPDYTVVNNTAYIYFDLNAPVVTDQTMNTLIHNIPVSIEKVIDQETISIYPNPFNESITITSKNNKPFTHLFILTDIQGRELNSTPLSTTHATIDLNRLSSGIYIYRLLNQVDGTVSIGKLIKQ